MRKSKFTETTFYGWKKKFGGLGVPDLCVAPISSLTKWAPPMMGWLHVVLLLAGLVAGAVAGMIWLVSSAHGHGLASYDRQFILLLGAAAVSFAVAALVVYLRQRS